MDQMDQNLQIKCAHCDLSWEYHISTVRLDGDGGHAFSVECHYCGESITLTSKLLFIKRILEKQASVFKKRSLVVLNNEDHVWHGEPAIICDVKPGFYRLEIVGTRLWVPYNWVKQNELDDVG